MQVVMPRLGESIVEGTIAKWRVEVGAQVRRGEIVAEVETDKATSEIPAPGDGRVSALLYEEGETVEVGTVIMELNDGSGRSGESATQPASTAAASVTAQGHGQLAPRPDNGRWSPAVRRLAREHQVDLTRVDGSGRHGRVTRDDIMRHVNQTNPTSDLRPPQASAPPPQASAPTQRPQPSAPPAVTRAEQTPFATQLPTQNKLTRPPVRYRPRDGDEVESFSRRRGLIADNLLQSLQTSAHVASVAEIDMLRVQRAKERDAASLGMKLTYMPYIVQAVAQALTEHPRLNASVVDRTMVLRKERNIGVAVDTPEGLVVPVLKRADELTIAGLARRLGELSERARAGKLTPDDVSDGSFTVSNPGRDGNLFGISIIRQPEVGILRVGSIVKRPVVREVEGEEVIVVRPIMYAALSYDHRVIDGRTGNAFLARITQLLSSGANL